MDLGRRPDEVDEGEILAALVRGLGGAFLKEERALVETLRAQPGPPGTLLARYQAGRMALLRARGFDVSGLTPEQMTSADDVYCFPNVVGPIYPGSAILFRVRPDGRDPGSAIQDTWVLEWPAPGTTIRSKSLSALINASANRNVDSVGTLSSSSPTISISLPWSRLALSMFEHAAYCGPTG